VDRWQAGRQREETVANSVGIVGGGAAGMMAAIIAARHGANVTLLEGNDRLGKKILSTGNGKCNLGNEKLDMDAYYTGQPEQLKNYLEQFDTADTIAFFREIGLLVKSKNGYLYPVCEQAAAVLDVLRYEIAELGVHVITGCKVTEIKPEAMGKIKVYGGGKAFPFDKVILACGGQAAPKTGSDGSGYKLAAQLGHTLIPVVPALVQLICREDVFKSVAGVRANALLSVYWKGNCVAQERGELQLTDYGISGIPVLQLSRIVNYLLMEDGSPKRSAEAKRSMEAKRSAEAKHSMEAKRTTETMQFTEAKRAAEIEVGIDFLPDYTEKAFRQLRERRALMQGQRTAEEFFTGLLHKKLMLLFIKMAGLKSSESIYTADRAKIDQVYNLCRQWKVHVIGSNSYDNAQVCAGGVPLAEITDNMESKKVPGVYFAGELLDVDGKCGGYNLQWAWCSGYLAGKAAAGGNVWTGA